MAGKGLYIVAAGFNGPPLSVGSAGLCAFGLLLINKGAAASAFPNFNTKHLVLKISFTPCELETATGMIIGLACGRSILGVRHRHP